MNFSTVTDIAIPEGKVVKIARNETTLWEKQMGLPADYQQVEYITTDGYQYIDTGVSPADYPDGIHYKMEYMLVDYYAGDFYRYFFGSRSSDGSRNAGNLCVNSYAGNWGFYCGAGRTDCFHFIDLRGNRIKISFYGNSYEPNQSVQSVSIIMNGEERAKRYNFEPRGGSEMPVESVYLLHCNGSTNQGMWGNLYGFTMTDANGDFIRDFIPCYRKTDRVIGAFDMVTKQFFTNSGTGVFTKGADV